MKKKYILLLLFTLTLKADQFSFLFYNDWFSGSDRHFTNGMSFSWINDNYGDTNQTNANSYSDFVYNAVNTLPFVTLDETKTYNAGISISQYMFTPENLEVSTPQYNDIPYAGYLSLAFYLFESDKRSFKESRIEFGVVGKESGVSWGQNKFHALIGNQSSKGWDTQMGTRYIINALFQYGEISWERNYFHGLSMDWFNHFGLNVGNYTTDTYAGTTFRIGKNYKKNFNLHFPYLKEEASLINLEKQNPNFGWSFSLGINAKLLAYSYILDEAKRQNYHLTKRPLNASTYVGVDLYYDTHKFTLFYDFQSPYTYEQNSLDTFGGVAYSFQF